MHMQSVILIVDHVLQHYEVFYSSLSSNYNIAIYNQKQPNWYKYLNCINTDDEPNWLY